MRYCNSVKQRLGRQHDSWRKRQFLCLLAVLALTLPAVSQAALGQTKAPAKRAPNHAAATSSTTKKPGAAKSDQDMAWLQDALKNPELMNELGRLSDRLTKEIQYPPLRTQSAVLPRLSQNTVFYAALPNFGPQLRQSLDIYRQELQGSAAMRDFLQKNHLDTSEPKFEDGIAKFCDFMDYLGDEVVITGGFKGKEPNGVLIAEVKKPGLRAFLEKIDQELNASSTEHLRFFDPQQLETATDHAGQEPVVLIRPDFVVISTSTATLRAFNAQLNNGGASFASTGLGKRLAQSYQSGTNSAFGVDLQQLTGLIPENPPQTRMILEKTGFADAKYAVMDGRLSKGRAEAKMELAFGGPRRGVASWIATPGTLGALDFMSPKASIGEAFRLKGLDQMFDDIVEIAGPGALAMLPQMEAQLNINLKQDILSKFTGEMGFEMLAPPIPPAGQAGMALMQPNFKFILGVSDPAGLQQALKRLLTQAPMQSGEWQEDGVTVSTLTSPSANGQGMEINYFFMDGYLVIATNRDLARDAVHAHRSGESLAKLDEITSAAGQPAKASAIVYQNTGLFLASILKQLPPDMASHLPQALNTGETKPNIMVATADDTTVRATTTNVMTTNVSMALIGAAIVIPNLLHSRNAANESAAMATMRTVNTAEITYKTSYPRKGFARTLAAMGPAPGVNANDCKDSNISAAHACLLDGKVGNASCIAGKWCEHNGYRYSIRAVCTQTSCSSYVVTAIPINESACGKSFCSTTDAVVRSHTGPPVAEPLTMKECKAWEPVM
ncbi:MAG TPA: DUF3352 domain-containing protein [Candidatus Angelobacter sp.]|nr:DUF3352 domain-containing protein [Candidatus Angelobacter sp.]